MRFLVITTCTAIIFGGCSYLNKKMGLEDDHFMEELAEKIVEKETGLVVDFSPDSPESD